MQCVGGYQDILKTLIEHGASVQVADSVGCLHELVHRASQFPARSTVIFRFTMLRLPETWR